MSRRRSLFHPSAATRANSSPWTPPVGGGDTQLAQAAAGMSSGQWLQVTPTGLGLFVGGPTSGLRTGYAHNIARDTAGKKMHWIGCDHNQTSKWLTFDEATHAWTLTQDPMPWGQPSDGTGTTAHGYDHSVWADGKLWHRPYGSTEIRRHDGGTTWGTIGYGGGDPVFNGSAANGCAFHPALGANGSIVIAQLENGINGACLTIDPVTGAKTLRSSALANMGDPHNFAVYSPTLALVWFGGGNGSTKSWTINASGTITACDDTPAPLGDIGPGNNHALPVYNPTTGRFTVFRSGTVWYDFDPSAASGSQWAVRSGTVSLFASDVYLTGAPTYGTVVCPLPEYGVVAFVKAWTSSQNAVMWLWKP